MLTTY